MIDQIRTAQSQSYVAGLSATYQQRLQVVSASNLAGTRQGRDAAGRLLIGLPNGGQIAARRLNSLPGSQEVIPFVSNPIAGASVTNKSL
jgi:hypothetical protein